MLTSRQRALLKSMANSIEPIIFVGKEGLTDNVVKQADDALAARELVKGTVQRMAPVNAQEAMDDIAERTGSEAVASAGRKFVLYRKKTDDPVIRL